MTKRPLYLIPTYHPAAERLLIKLNEEYDIVFYNKNANERAAIHRHEYDFTDLKLTKITLKKLDFAFTNTLPVVALIIRKRPQFVVTEDYLFCLPYLICCKILRIKIIYFNGSTAPQSTRIKSNFIKLIKGRILSCFDDFWHGFRGAEKYVTKYINVESKLRPWFLMTKPAVSEVIHHETLQGIYVGEFNKRKRIRYILEFYEITENFDNVNITLVGCHKDSTYYHNSFSALPHKQTLNLMSQNHFLLLLSKREAMGAVVLEALANGLFVVLSKEVGASSFVTETDSYHIKPPGVLHYNSIGCIIDPEIISPQDLLSWLEENKSIILSNRNQRSAEINEHYIR